MDWKVSSETQLAITCFFFHLLHPVVVVVVVIFFYEAEVYEAFLSSSWNTLSSEPDRPAGICRIKSCLSESYHLTPDCRPVVNNEVVTLS